MPLLHWLSRCCVHGVDDTNPFAHPLQATPTGLDLHYRSVRMGLQGIMEGAIRESARIFFGLDVGLELLRGRERGDCDHEVSGL